MVEEAVGAVEELLGAFRQGRAGRDAVHQNAMWPQFESHGTRQVDDAGFRRHKGALQTQRNQAGDRRDIDDSACPLRTHDFSGRLADFINACQIHR